MEQVSLLVVLGAGLSSFLSTRVLPLAPVYLSCLGSPEDNITGIPTTLLITMMV